jgi:CubicO group peptidase (beta-lactamase class C family)
VASVAKQFTAAVVSGLVVDGAISLSSPVRPLLPELPASWDPVEVGHLVAHTAGLAVRDVDEQQELAATVQERITALAAASPVDVPGQVHLYSNRHAPRPRPAVTRAHHGAPLD